MTIILLGQVLVAIGKQLVEVTLADAVLAVTVAAIEPLPLHIHHPTLVAVLQQEVWLQLEHLLALVRT